MWIIISFGFAENLICLKVYSISDQKILVDTQPGLFSWAPPSVLLGGYNPSHLIKYG